ELVDHAATDKSLQVEHRVRRVGGDLQMPPRDAVRRIARALVVEHSDVGRPVASQLEVEPAAEGVFLDLLALLKLREVDVRVGRSTGQDHRAGGEKTRS